MLSPVALSELELGGERRPLLHKPGIPTSETRYSGRFLGRGTIKFGDTPVEYIRVGSGSIFVPSITRIQRAVPDEMQQAPCFRTPPNGKCCCWPNSPCRSSTGGRHPDLHRPGSGRHRNDEAGRKENSRARRSNVRLGLRFFDWK